MFRYAPCYHTTRDSTPVIILILRSVFILFAIALTIEEKCTYGATFIPHPSECQLYYDCSFSYDGPIPRFFEQHMLECDYPAYFNTETNTCDFDFENVDCGNRARHIDACKYLLIHFKIFLDCAFVRYKVSRVGSLIIFNTA